MSSLGAAGEHVSQQIERHVINGRLVFDPQKELGDRY